MSIFCPSCDKECDHPNWVYMHPCEKFICVVCWKEHIKTCPVSLACNTNNSYKKQRVKSNG